MTRGRKVIVSMLLAGFLSGAFLAGGPVDAATTGWAHNAKGWWYTRSDGSYPANKWEKIDGAWYHFNAKGFMDTGWLKDGDYWFYLASNGVMQTGWKQISGNWFYFNDGGVMQTGWKKIGGKWYLFNASGVMQSGWKKVDGKWYFLKNGAMQTGWAQISGNWYFFNASGVMQTGWKKISGNWYYFTSSGTMVTGRVKINGKLYLFNENGVWDEKAYNFSDAKVGDDILFGYYEQDNNAENGKEQIAWRVLQDNDGTLLLMSEKVLDCKYYHETEENVTWETSDLRGWLNSDFLSAAFDKDEQEMIELTHVSTPDSEYYGTDSGNDTEDKVFLLSYDEIMSIYEDEEYTQINPVTGEPMPDTFTGSKDRAAAPTAYALANGVATTTSSEWFGGNCEWWLRSMGYDQTFVSFVDSAGYVTEGGDWILNKGVGVRPVICVKK